MTTDPFTEAARAEAERTYGHLPFGPQRAGLEAGHAHAAEWARSYLAAQEPQVTIRRTEGRPATCEVRQGGVLIFSGRDHSADLQVAAQEPTDAEVEAAARALWAEVWIDPDEHPWDTEATGAERASCRREARAALSAARAARRDEEDR